MQRPYPRFIAIKTNHAAVVKIDTFLALVLTHEQGSETLEVG
jgi:hypothetical protein